MPRGRVRRIERRYRGAHPRPRERADRERPDGVRWRSPSWGASERLCRVGIGSPGKPTQVIFRDLRRLGLPVRPFQNHHLTAESLGYIGALGGFLEIAIVPPERAFSPIIGHLGGGLGGRLGRLVEASQQER